MTTEQLIDLLESWDALVRNLQKANLVLRAERDEARRAHAELARPPASKPTLPGTRGSYGRKAVLVPAQLQDVAHMTAREAAAALGVSHNTVARYRRAIEIGKAS